MKQTIFSLIVLLFVVVPILAAPGDVVSDRVNSIWLIAAKPGLLSELLNNMNAVPEGYAAKDNQERWAIWLEREILVDLGKAFPAQVYTDVINKFIGYNYGNTRIADEYKAPQNVQVTTGQITCNEDPTSENRTVLLYKRVGMVFTEQAIAGTSDAGTWTFSTVPVGSFYVLAYGEHDDFKSFPTEYLTIE
jgi:hypothetical protein